MNKIETNHLIRWILIIPGTLLAAALELVCGLVIIEFFSQTNDAFGLWLCFFIFLFILPATTAIIWVSASYYIAPSHRLIIVWVSWVISSLVVIFLLLHLLTLSITPMPLLISAVTGGLLASLYYTYKIKAQ